MLGAVPTTVGKQRIVLEFARDEDIAFNENQYEKEKIRFRRLTIGSCKMLDNKLEKNGTFEFTPGVSVIWLILMIIERGGFILRMR